MCHYKTIFKMIKEAMFILWGQGIMYDNVLLLISNVASYMLKAGQTISVFNLT